MRCALDTNILVYAEGVNGPDRQTAAANLLERLACADLILATQTLGELFSVLRRKGGYSGAEAVDLLGPWRTGYRVVPTSTALFDRAVRNAASSELQIWDCIILEAAADAGCSLLLSEDMQDGFVYRGVTVANPFAERLHPLLASLLDTLSQDPPAGAPT
ncbi:PIN domain-containing protein [Brevundimonas sp.]|uniref:PIN domain-containing protein n=1 Tax=Brevundimonas sp. TaxID=1871086 RepID=UPI0027305C49|nr:PIN domain-containing protein [Brevundimonas sp.]MDP1912789.1 PIN domain-containing protein [Brevundimonas sp.]